MFGAPAATCPGPTFDSWSFQGNGNSTNAFIYGPCIKLGFDGAGSGGSDNTIAAYRRDMHRFTSWVGERNLSQIQVGDLSDYVANLHQQELALTQELEAMARARTTG